MTVCPADVLLSGVSGAIIDTENQMGSPKSAPPCRVCGRRPLLGLSAKLIRQIAAQGLRDSPPLAPRVG
jgi:hypothetical protein